MEEGEPWESLEYGGGGGSGMRGEWGAGGGMSVGVGDEYVCREIILSGIVCFNL